MESGSQTSSEAALSLSSTAVFLQAAAANIQTSAAAFAGRATAGGACYNETITATLTQYSSQMTSEAARVSRLARNSGAYVTLFQTNLLGFYVNTYRIYLSIVYYILVVLLVLGFLLALHLQHRLHC
jgi:hypothetical protein